MLTSIEFLNDLLLSVGLHADLVSKLGEAAFREDIVDSHEGVVGVVEGKD